MLTLEIVKSWIGVSGTDQDVLLTQLIAAADLDLKAKAGDYGDSELADLYKKYWIGVIYADRFGEMSNKENSAIVRAMDNILFELRLQVEAEKNEDDDT